MTISFNVAPVDVINEALGQLGKDFITDPDNPDDPVAVKASRYFGSLLRAMLRDHLWNFAKDRIPLAQNVTAPISQWTYSYALPSDCFRVRSLNGSNKIRWEIEGRNLLTGESPATIQYIKWVADPNLWPGDFYQAFVTYLAVRFAPAFNSDVAKASDLYKVYQMQIIDAKAVDGQESGQEEMTCDDLTDSIRE